MDLKITKKFYSIFFLIISFTLFNCTSTNQLNGLSSNSFEDIYFNAVSKKLIIPTDIPSDLKKDINYWFDNHVKVNGFEGSLEINFFNYEESVNEISDGKKIELYIEYEIIIKSPSNSSSKKTFGSAKTFSEIVGVFNLNDLDELLISSKKELVIIIANKIISLN